MFKIHLPNYETLTGPLVLKLVSFLFFHFTTVVILNLSRGMNGKIIKLCLHAPFHILFALHSVSSTTA